EKWSAGGFATTKFTFTVPADQKPTIPHAEYLFKPNFLTPQVTVVARVETKDGEVQLTSNVLFDVAL
ncbi:hypothetical protein JYT90_01120, partial [bacterium AH-315-P07]|nr:hypothetical protein [bacterium AH-315-P07]